ncbi:MAG TPA: hypothetical protein VMT47_13170 [Polyangia bacterium]|nr:hypothetical protein [Polyangia bacterium]
MNNATFSLACERGGDMRMELTTDASGTRVVNLRIAPLAKRSDRDACRGG